MHQPHMLLAAPSSFSLSHSLVNNLATGFLLFMRNDKEKNLVRFLLFSFSALNSENENKLKCSKGTLRLHADEQEKEISYISSVIFGINNATSNK